MFQSIEAQFPRPLARGLGDSGESVLHVLVMISNPVRYYARYELFDAYRQQNDRNVVMWVVEVALGDRPFAVTEAGNPRHLQLRTRDDLWHKENALNLLMQRVLCCCPDAQYFAWIDADVTFARADWAHETLHQLQHYQVVQLFSHAQDVDPQYQPIGPRHAGFIYSYYNDESFMLTSARFGYTSAGHPGFAWAARRGALDTVGGLIDFAITGGADRHMACGLIGTIERSGPYAEARLDQLSRGFNNLLLLWQRRAALLHKNVGYVNGLLLHHWHGRKIDRRYGNRWKIYTRNRYDPTSDLRRDTQGLYALDPDRTRLRDDLRSYFRARNEDSITTEG